MMIRDIVTMMTIIIITVQYRLVAPLKIIMIAAPLKIIMIDTLQVTITTTAAAHHFLTIPCNCPQVITMMASCYQGGGMSKDIISILPHRGILVTIMLSMKRRGKKIAGVSSHHLRIL